MKSIRGVTSLPEGGWSDGGGVVIGRSWELVATDYCSWGVSVARSNWPTVCSSFTGTGRRMNITTRTRSAVATGFIRTGATNGRVNKSSRSRAGVVFSISRAGRTSRRMNIAGRGSATVGTGVDRGSPTVASSFIRGSPTVASSIIRGSPTVTSSFGSSGVASSFYRGGVISIVPLRGFGVPKHGDDVVAIVGHVADLVVQIQDGAVRCPQVGHLHPCLRTEHKSTNEYDAVVGILEIMCNNNY